MKKSAKKIGLLIAITLFVISLNAQEKGLTVGSRIGIGESSIQLGSSSKNYSKLGLGIGATSNYQFTNYFGVITDLVLVSKGGKFEGVTTTNFLGTTTDYSYEDNYRLFYAEIPMMAKLSLKLTENLFVKGFAGPSINFKLAAIETREYENSNFNDNNGYRNRTLDDLNTIDYSLIYGVGVDVIDKNGSIVFIDFRVSNALAKAGEINGTDIENTYFLISTGYFF